MTNSFKYTAMPIKPYTQHAFFINIQRKFYRQKTRPHRFADSVTEAAADLQMQNEGLLRQTGEDLLLSYLSKLSPEMIPSKQQPERRVFKIELNDFNSFVRYASEVLHNLPTSSSLLDQPERSNQEVEKERNLFPKSSSKQSVKKLTSKQQTHAGQLQPKASNLNSFNNLSKQQRLRQVSEIRQAEMRFSLQRLAVLVKIYLQQHSFAVIENLYMDILGNYLHRIGLSQQEAEELLSNIRRRICEVLRVLDGLGAVTLDRRMVFLTEMGKYKGKGLFRHFKRRQTEYEDKKRNLKQLTQQKDEWNTILNSFNRLRVRNEQSLKSNQHEESKMLWAKSKRQFKLPLTFIAGPPRPSIGIFKAPLIEDIRQVEINHKTGGIMIKGESLRILPLSQVLLLINKS